MLYLTGSSSELSRNLHRSDLGLLGTPAGSTVAQRHHYPAWAADNGMFVATPATREALIAKWFAWLGRLEPTALFATLPDVVGDYRATAELSRHHLAAVRELGFPAAWVAQDGLELDPWATEEALSADALFLGGSTEWKLSAGAAELVAEAKRRGLWVHMGRVNSGKRLRYAASIGCDSADGTFLGFGPTKNLPRLVAWLDSLNPPAPAHEFELAA